MAGGNNGSRNVVHCHPMCTSYHVIVIVVSTGDGLRASPLGPEPITSAATTSQTRKASTAHAQRASFRFRELKTPPPAVAIDPTRRSTHIRRRLTRRWTGAHNLVAVDNRRQKRGGGRHRRLWLRSRAEPSGRRSCPDAAARAHTREPTSRCRTIC